MQTTDFPTVEYMNMLEWYQKKKNKKEEGQLAQEQTSAESGGWCGNWV